tara:strand:- start:191 stop:646 length:456 start_codon:yes stop_codon:yes gene_type:complete
MATTTFQGIVRSYGGGIKGTHTPTPVTQSVQVSFDPTASSATNVRIGTSATSGETLTLPAGAIPISFLTIGGAAGGSSPTVDIGSSGDPDGLFNEVDADSKGSLTGADGALAVAGGLAASITVTGKVGASAATSGTFTGVLTYAMANNSVE